MQVAPAQPVQVQPAGGYYAPQQPQPAQYQAPNTARTADDSTEQNLLN